jgi:rhodanese-related sulfurtransferase
MAVVTIHPADLAERSSAKQITLIDVRTPTEFEEIHVEGARNVPLDQLDPKAVSAKCADSECIYVICRSGSRGKQACERLLAAGVQSVVNVEGGTLACEQAGLPMVRGRKTMSLERQVRIAAGLLVVIGTLLGAFVHPAFLGISAFVGAGLVFAGVTDTCGMGMMLAKMPWNRRAPNKGCSVG